MQQKAISCTRAVEMIPDGASLMIGGFMGVGSPHRVIDELVRQGRKNLTVICNDTGKPGWGIGKLSRCQTDSQAYRHVTSVSIRKRGGR